MKGFKRLDVTGMDPVADIPQSADVTHAQISYDGRMIVTANKGSKINIYDMTMLKCKFIINCPSPVTCIRLTRDTQMLLAGHADGKLIVYRLKDCKTLLNTGIHQGEVTSIDVSADSLVCATAGEDKKIIVWGLGSFVKSRLPFHYHILEKHTHGGIKIRFSDNCRTLASVDSSKKLMIWDMESGDCIEEVTLDNKPASQDEIARYAKLNPESLLDDYIRGWVLKQNAVLRYLDTCKAPMLWAEPDCDVNFIFALCDDGSIKIVTFYAGVCSYVLEGVPVDAKIAVSRNSEYILFTERNSIKVWKINWEHSVEESMEVLSIMARSVISNYIQTKKKYGKRGKIKFKQDEITQIIEDIRCTGFDYSDTQNRKEFERQLGFILDGINKKKAKN